MLVILGAVAYVVCLLPLYSHREAWPLHLGAAALAVALWRHSGSAWRFTLRATFIGLAIACYIAAGFMGVERAEADFRETHRRLFFERTGLHHEHHYAGVDDDIAHDVAAVELGNAAALEQLVRTVRDKRPGWGRVAGALHRLFIDERHDDAPYHSIEEPASGYTCGTSYMTPAGFDHLRLYKTLVRVETLRAATAAEVRETVLADVDSGAMARKVALRAAADAASPRVH